MGKLDIRSTIMAQVLTIKLSDDMQQKLQERADRLNVSLEDSVLQLLTRLVDTPTVDAIDDPVEKFIGAFSSDVTDWCGGTHPEGNQHDRYLGKSALGAITKEANA